jgi:hypothetical protein
MNDGKDLRGSGRCMLIIILIIIRISIIITPVIFIIVSIFC